MAEHNAQVGRAHQPHGRNMVALAQAKRFSTSQPGDGRPLRQRNGNDRVVQARAKRRHKSQRQNEAGKGQEQLGNAHQDRIEPAAIIAGETADDEADRRDDDTDNGDDRECDAASPQDAAQNIPAKLVGTKKVLAVWRSKVFAQVLLERRIWGKPWHKDRDENQQQDDRKTGEAERIGRKPRQTCHAF